MAALNSLAAEGYEKATISAVAAQASTSKQAVYRRFADKPGLIAAAVETAFARLDPPPPQRGSVAEDLRQSLTSLVVAMQETPLGEALRALLPFRSHPVLGRVLDMAEADRRLHLRQIFIATPFETDMEVRIDLLLGLIYYRLLMRGAVIDANSIERAIYLVLGLVPPRAPSA
ncbi:TetR/AcrR family transcriptional regulator [Roseibium denhamense]|uniref:Transcriptional regulator, TetR family n=1 Tax=Roseibium denhamense TaxID=76305 RepID=A0ABY1N9W2_9HYPH|nr:TetR/AcrR family transcriptional regulator [Roseibium denhamense]MTI04033.1 TetR/AcrR family transcriptional regulator [Roseibium denhamense]SMP04352.1 transcriptional regulator, TetR family [Roseibium denhamense]